MSLDIEQRANREADGIPGLTEEERHKAAISVQRTYRGHRTRRALKGHSLDPSTRWVEAIKDAQFREVTTPHGPKDFSKATDSTITDPQSGRRTPARADDNDARNLPAPEAGKEKEPKGPSPARKQWYRVGQIALRAGADDPPEDESDSESLSDSANGTSISPDDGSPSKEERQARRQRRAQARTERKKLAKMMDLQYFLEMVDHKHRYGSNLRKYHNRWKSQPTSQNFFYWLDYGEGKDVELAECSRERLQKEQVRYLSREERLDYLVKVDHEGKLRWAKNDERITTDDDEYRDSLHGIVHKSSDEPVFESNNENGEVQAKKPHSEDEDDDDDEHDKNAEAEHYADNFTKTKGPSKLAKVSPAVIFDHLLRAQIKRGNKWIFVADTSSRLYVGIKASGSFQHSSFLHGARISAAGLIKIKDGQLRSLSPLSGHYRPPAANFRSFIQSLRDEGVDMSHVSISKSYAVLVGIEGYTKTRKKMKKMEGEVKRGVEKVVHPGKVKEEEKKREDKSESAQKERKWIEEQKREAVRREEERKRARRESLGQKLMRRLHIDEEGHGGHHGHNRSRHGGSRTSLDSTASVAGAGSGKISPRKSHEESRIPDPPEPTRVPGGSGPEDGVPAPEGQR